MRYLRREVAILEAEGLCVRVSLPGFYCERNRLQSRRELCIVKVNTSLRIKNTNTSQPVDGPLLEFLELDLGGRGGFVETESVEIILLLELGNSELPFFVIVDITSS